MEIVQNTSRTRRTKIWVASPGRPAISDFGWKWAEAYVFPKTPEGLTDDAWKRIVESVAPSDVIEQWKRNATIESI